MKSILAAFFLLLATPLLLAQDVVATVEAESGTPTGVNIAEQAYGSSQKYVTGFDAAGDRLAVKIQVPESKFYKLVIRYRSSFGNKVQDLLANEVFIANVSFPQSTVFTDLDAGSIPLTKGSNTITIRNNWGYVDLDKFSVYTLPVNTFQISAALIDPLATKETKELYNFLKTNFGKNIISGQTDSKYEELKKIVGKSPMLRAYDLLTYSLQYPYSWANGGHAFGPVPDSSPENAIAWYNGTGKKGIVSFHWHWYSPSGGKVGSNTFSTGNTTFDVRQAVINGTQQNKDALRDIDAIAIQLKKISDAGVPILWRPLHEAGGGWFWWGANGSEACKKLWDIVYDRLVNFHQFHNMIWVWSTPEADWYPGNGKTDMIGFDSYPGDFNYTPQKNVFDKLYQITEGKKLIALSENGPVPDMKNCLDSDAPWSYFMSWSDLVFSQNSTQHLLDTYANPKVLTLENPTGPAEPVITANEESRSRFVDIYPNPFRNELTLKSQESFEYTIYNLPGMVVEQGKKSATTCVGASLAPGIYLIRIEGGQKLVYFKVVKY